jgi:hypothetical protein
MNFISPRAFFARLRYSDDHGFQVGSRESSIGYPVFGQQELEQSPLKWLKYVLLAQLGLRPIKELEKDIRRFAINDWLLAKDCCRQLLANAKKDKLSILLVVKLVPLDKAGQLPNFRITKDDNLDKIFDEIVLNITSEYREVWICQTIVDFNTRSFAGRFTIPGYQNYGASWLEVVWFTSPRLLETINWNNLTQPSLRAFRPVGSIEFRIEKMHIPSNDPLELKRYTQDFIWLKSKIEENKEKISELETILSTAGAHELCLEFKVDNGHFQFIDWDTDIENINTPVLSNKIV